MRMRFEVPAATPETDEATPVTPVTEATLEVDGSGDLVLYIGGALALYIDAADGELRAWHKDGTRGVGYWDANKSGFVPEEPEEPLDK